VTLPLRPALSDAWDTLAGGVPGVREWRALRIAAGHALDVFAAVRERDGARGVLFECAPSSAPVWRLRFESEGLQLLDERDAAEGVRRIALALERSDLESIFPVIVEDLVEASRPAADAQEALAALGARLAAWQTCLKVRKDGFGPDRVRGLYGELIVLEHMGALIGLDRAVAAWTGPTRGLHDFVADDLAIEVKTSAGASGAIWIGSLDQLDPSEMNELALVRVILVPDDAGVRLSDLIGRVRASANRLGATVRRSIDQRLLMSGYVDQVGHHPNDDPLNVVDSEAYLVHGDFPRLTRETVSAAVLAAEYRLDVGGARGHRMTAEAIEDLMVRIGGKL
jgi:hypothetical protein